AKDGTVIAGHGRLAAAKSLKLPQVPTITLEDLSADQIRAYVVADNRLAEIAGWDRSILAIELQNLLDVEDFDISVTGFTVPEIDLIIEEATTKNTEENEAIEVPYGAAINRVGDRWSLGKHRVICANSLEESSFWALM